MIRRAWSAVNHLEAGARQDCDVVAGLRSGHRMPQCVVLADTEIGHYATAKVGAPRQECRHNRDTHPPETADCSLLLWRTKKRGANHSPKKQHSTGLALSRFTKPAQEVMKGEKEAAVE